MLILFCGQGFEGFLTAYKLGCVCPCMAGPSPRREGASAYLDGAVQTWGACSLLSSDVTFDAIDK